MLNLQKCFFLDKIMLVVIITGLHGHKRRQNCEYYGRFCELNSNQFLMWELHAFHSVFLLHSWYVVLAAQRNLRNQIYC